MGLMNSLRYKLSLALRALNRARYRFSKVKVRGGYLSLLELIVILPILIQSL